MKPLCLLLSILALAACQRPAPALRAAPPPPRSPAPRLLASPRPDNPAAESRQTVRREETRQTAAPVPLVRVTETPTATGTVTVTEQFGQPPLVQTIKEETATTLGAPSKTPPARFGQARQLRPHPLGRTRLPRPSLAGSSPPHPHRSRRRQYHTRTCCHRRDYLHLWPRPSSAARPSSSSSWPPASPWPFSWCASRTRKAKPTPSDLPRRHPAGKRPQRRAG